MLLGSNNVAGPTLKELETNFGLSPLIYKPLAIISDARISGKMDSQIVIERLLSITGEDSLNVPRKFLPDWIGQLPTRFLILTNELPNFPDTSGAISSRFILLQLTQSFLGREDRQLTEKLSKELPGILNWALDGLARLTNRGHFILPKSSEDALEELEHLSSPIKAFVHDCCTIAHGKQVSGPELFEAWRSWCTEQGRDHTGTIQAFGKNLRTAFPFVKDTRPRGGETRHRLYQGLSLKPASVGPRWSAIFPTYAREKGKS
jgi:putative DNA primase/helicase